jgi:hypothetical protein
LRFLSSKLILKFNCHSKLRGGTFSRWSGQGDSILTNGWAVGNLWQEWVPDKKIRSAPILYLIQIILLSFLTAFARTSKTIIMARASNLTSSWS